MSNRSAQDSPIQGVESSIPESDNRQRLPDPSKRCNCRQSKCVKLYCECYQANVFCDANCHCQSCQNNPENEKSRLEAIRGTLERNPQAFQPKIAVEREDPLAFGRHNKGCACRKSGCMKKYCECFQAKVPCSENCKCLGWSRNHGFLTREHFLRTTDNEESSQQNILYQLLLAKDNDHMQSLINEQNLFIKPLFTNQAIEDLCLRMVTVANSNIQSVVQRKKIKKIVDHEVKVETKKEEEGSEAEDLRCDNESAEKIEEEVISEDEVLTAEDQKKQIILELFLKQLKQAEQ